LALGVAEEVKESSVKTTWPKAKLFTNAKKAVHIQMLLVTRIVISPRLEVSNTADRHLRTAQIGGHSIMGGRSGHHLFR
jgi:hypothetical protein